MLAAAILAGTLAAASPVDQGIERQVVVTISSRDIDNGILSEITWDGAALLLQGIVANPDGSLSGRYLVVPTKGTTLTQAKAQPAGSLAYWERKAKRTSPSGLGHIEMAQDAKMPIYGISSLEKRFADAVDMGGTQQRVMVRLGSLLLHEKETTVEPYDGEIWSWSPAELNRIAYVDGSGNLWVARADGSNAQRLLKGHFTLPAWSDDGRAIAVAEKKKDGREWEVSIVLLPPKLRTPE